MGYRITLSGFSPSPRDDGRPWVSYVIEEAPTIGAPRVQIDAQGLVPVDPDPADPAVRSVQTSAATVPYGAWYWVTFVDNDGGMEPHGPSFNMADAFMPTAEQVRLEFPQMPWEEWGYPAPGPGEQDSLDVVLNETQTEIYGYLSKLVTAEPDERAPLIRRAVKMLTVFNAGSVSAEVAETAFDYDMISAMSASDYSETRRGVTRPNPQVLHPWPALNRLLELILDYGGLGSEDGPGVTKPGACPAPYEPLTIERNIRGLRGRGIVGGPVWPWP